MKTRFDTLLGRFTMYRLTLALLVALALEAFLLSAVGLLAFTLPELAATLAVTLISTVVGTRLMALILRLRPHTESTLITGLILFFVMFPSNTLTGLGGIAVAGLAAAASKFLLAVRGRHIFNPAAIGAVIATLLGVSAAGWWVANPYLLPPVLLGALVLLYRKGKLTLGLAFVAVSAAILIGGLVGDGLTAGAAAQLIFLSYPILFLVGFLLTEPLTLPPLRWQQLAVAVVVAVVLASQPSIGPILLGPEVALVIGNAVAFLMGQRRGVRLRYTGQRQLTPTSTELVFEPARPVRFDAGQYMELTLPHARADARGARRTFSITSAPQDTSRISFGLRTAEPGSSFKKALLGLREGASITGTLVGGDFRLPGDPSVPLLLAAGGIGVTPFLSQLRDVTERGEERDIVLLYVVAAPSEIAYLAELKDLGTRVILFASADPADDGVVLPASWRYAGSGYPDADALLREIPDLRDRRAYVSGSPRIIAHLRAALKQAGTKRVATDAFLGY
ncbi:ferredoxin-NADP reductase [Arthrobacter sp. CAN_A214]|uniref:FAD-dependent oxidoreductase n=1 Tax=Arthrobacter sp. CAN_A214 TaxID=2787720 RepID=UPI0018CBDA63